MKLIIFEGCDRTGKDTLINSLINKFPNVIKRHWSSPIGNTNKERIEYQKKQFNKEFKLYSYLNQIIPESVMVWNRSHIGEAVYGTMYRNYNPEWIYNLEKKYSFDTNPDIYLIYLYADPEFLINHDDGESFSTNLLDKQKELDLFFSAFYKTKIKKKIHIQINKNNQYTPIQESFEKITNLLHI